MVLGCLDLCLVWGLITLTRSMKRNPVTIAGHLLTMKVGRLKTIEIPLDRISGVRESLDAAALKAKGVRNIALGTWPNVLVDLAIPIGAGRGEVRGVAHRLDNPAAFAAAIRRLASAA